jgi:hypothetical protein
MGLVLVYLLLSEGLFDTPPPQNQTVEQELAGRKQIFVLLESRPLRDQFILYDNGMILFQKSVSGESHWFQIHLNHRDMAEIRTELENNEFGNLAPRYWIRSALGEDLWMCVAWKGNKRIETSLTSVTKTGSDNRRNTDSPALPESVFKLLKFVSNVRKSVANSWTPLWIDLSLESEAGAWRDSSRLPGPARALPNEWLEGSTRPDDDTIRISGRFADAVREFLREREETGPVMVGDREFHLTAVAALPGKMTCMPTGGVEASMQ